jgi:hypothetical protein
VIVLTGRLKRFRLDGIEVRAEIVTRMSAAKSGARHAEIGRSRISLRSSGLRLLVSTLLLAVRAPEASGPPGSVRVVAQDPTCPYSAKGAF